jgi:drug/metabolite transporter (DMT)-like permease
MLVAVFLMSFMDICTKHVAAHYPLIQVVFFRSLFSFIPLLWIFYRTPQVKVQLQTHHMFSHFIRALLGVIAITGFAHGFGTMPLANVYAIEFSSPFFMVFLSYFFFKESLDIQKLTAVLLGFICILIIVRPGSEDFQMSTLSVFMASFLFAGNAIHMRILSKTDTQTAVVFYFFFYGCIISGLILPFYWMTPTLQDLSVMALVGLFSGLSQIYMAKAFAHSPVSTLAPFYYLIMVFGVILGWLFWNEIPKMYVVLGSLLIILCGMYTNYHENKKVKTA